MDIRRVTIDTVVNSALNPTHAAVAVLSVVLSELEPRITLATKWEDFTPAQHTVYRAIEHVIATQGRQ